MTKRDRYLLIAIGGLLIILPLTLVLLRQRLDLRPRAEFGNATLALSPTEATLAPGATTTFDFSIDSGEFPLSGMDISFAFNADVINITGITINTDSGFTDTIVNEIGQASARFAIVARKPTTQLPEGNITIATLTVSALNPGTSPLEIRPTEIVGFNGIEDDVRLNVGGVTNANITVTGEGQQPRIQGFVEVRIKDESGNILTNDDLTNVDTLLTPRGLPTRINKIKQNYDPSSTPYPTYRYEYTNDIVKERVYDIVALAYYPSISSPGVGRTGDFVVTEDITIKNICVGHSYQYLCDDFGPTPTVTLPPDVTPTATPTFPPGVTPTPTAPDTPLLTFKTDFIGMSYTRPDLTVRLTVVDELQLTPTQNVYRPIISAGPDGKYQPLQSPLPLIGVVPGQGKTLLVKGPKHLQKKTAYRIELRAGNNGPFDWTAAALKLEPGDLPDPNNNMQQDGVVNAVDVGLLVAILNDRPGSRDSRDTQIADLNYDGVVNTNDLSLMIETLSTKYDDEF